MRVMRNRTTVMIRRQAPIIAPWLLQPFMSVTSEEVRGETFRRIFQQYSDARTTLAKYPMPSLFAGAKVSAG